MVESRWHPGDAVTLREIWRGQVWRARPLTVVRDAGDLMMFCGSARGKAPTTPQGRPLRLPADDWTLTDVAWDTRVLSFAWPGAAHAILAFWEEPDDAFQAWYINVQSPLRRTAIGFDYQDQLLDVVVAPDLSEWRWKDQDELEEAVRIGLFTEHQARGFEAEAERALQRLLDREPPFDRDWRDWKPDPSWSVPELAPGWDVVVPR